MAARQCPNCFAVVPAGVVAAHSNDIVCAGCGRPLEISNFSRILAAFAGLAAGAIVWRIASAHLAHDASALGWVLPIVYSYLALSIVAPLVLIVTADLLLKPEDESPISHDAPAASTTH
ncbi:MAG: hypothetical protein WBP79_04665 [Candidatus Acidiferrales bacterium]